MVTTPEGTPLLRRGNTEQTAHYSGIPQSTLEKMRHRGNGPRYIKRGRSVIYDFDDIDAYLDSLKVTSTSESDVRPAEQPVARPPSDPAAPRRRGRPPGSGRKPAPAAPRQPETVIE